MWVQRLRGAFWRYAVEVAEKALAEDAIDLDGKQQIRELTADELDLISARVREKVCSYQTRVGRELGCTATHWSGTQITSKPICLTCALPDDEYLCSALTAPRVDKNETIATRYLNEQDFEEVAYRELVRRIYEDLRNEAADASRR